MYQILFGLGAIGIVLGVVCSLGYVAVAQMLKEETPHGGHRAQGSL